MEHGRGAGQVLICRVTGKVPSAEIELDDYRVIRPGTQGTRHYAVSRRTLHSAPPYKRLLRELRTAERCVTLSRFGSQQ